MANNNDLNGPPPAGTPLLFHAHVQAAAAAAQYSADAAVSVASAPPQPLQ